MGKSSLSVAVAVVITFLSICHHNVDAVAVMSVDLGSEWIKIGIVSPGVPMEIVLNKESKRKTPVAISLRDGERLIGEDALNVAVRFPQSAYLYFLDLLGKKMDNPMVQLFRNRFPFYNLVADEERGTVMFQHDSETRFSPEELLGMILHKCREYAQDFARQPVNEVVITVPPFFNQAERRAVLVAANLAGLKVLQLMNTNIAAGLNYGIFRRKDFNETPHYVLLYDMGASSTVATVLSYQVTKTKERGMVETNPQVQVLGVGYDRTLGGLEMQLRLRDFLGRAFNDQKKTPTNVFSNHRSMAKLFKEAGRVKNVLSANADHFAQVEGLLDEKDFRVQVTREQTEKLWGDLFERVKGPVEMALNTAAIPLDIINQVILIGAGTRVPKVQERLAAFVRRELGKSLNTDESAAMGAVYRAADLSTGFKVMKFNTKDAVLFPILVDFEREVEGEDGLTTLKIIRRTLFSQMNPYPQKKILTFNKHVNDFTFFVSYGDLSLPRDEILAVGSSNITKVDLKGVAEALQKNAQEGIEVKGVKAHFSMDDSGIFSLNVVESVFERNSTAEDEESTAGDTLAKLGSAFSKLFSGGSDESSTATPPESEGGQEESSGSEKTEAEDEKSKKDSTKDEDSDKKTNQTDHDSSTKQNMTTEKSDENVKKTKTVVIKETLQSTSHVLDVQNLEGDRLKAAQEKLNEMNEQDRLRVLREKSRNSLESLVLDMQDKIFSSDYEHVATQDEKDKISQACSEISDWLYEEGANAEKSQYEEKFKSLKLMTKDLMDRVREHKERPDALEALEKMLNISRGFMESSKKLSEDEQYFTEVELTTLDKLVTETDEWLTKKVDEQANIPLTQAPVLTVRSLAEKIDSLDREVKYMINKARVNKLKKQREEATAKEKEATAGTAENVTNNDGTAEPQQTSDGQQQEETTTTHSEGATTAGSKPTSQESPDDSTTKSSKSQKKKHSEL